MGIQSLVAHSGNVARNKQDLLTAIGPSPSDALQLDGAGNIVGVKTALQKMPVEDFEKLMGTGLNPFKQADLSLDPNDPNNQSRTPSA